MIFERWSVIVVPFPFTDMDVNKKRPAIILSPSELYQATGHFICGMITSGQHSDWVTDVPLTGLDEAGLRKPCKFRCKLFTLHGDLVLRRIGTVGATDRAAITRVTGGLLPT